MKKVFGTMLILLFCSSVWAEKPTLKYYPNMPEGTFKAKRNGDIVHYDKHGKKIGIYKITSGRYIKVK